ncbi:glutamine synthetase isoform X2 [Aplysia californica]|nr:glutamine synthetase isoform X2 [Aplysia californica]
MTDSFDYFELVVYDVHCVQRGRMLARRRMDRTIRDGLGIYTGVCYFGMLDEPNVHPKFGELANYSNSNLKPDMSTLTRSLKSAGGQGRVGHVICNLELLNGKPDMSCPRIAAQNQISKLAELGLTIKSSSEIEFDIRNTETNEDFGHTAQWASINIVEDQQAIILELLDELSDINVNVDTFQTEAGPGQYEITMDIAEGIKGPDSTARFKNASKTFFRKRGYTASYMTKVDLNGISSGMHFNHSLWTNDGLNAFKDPSQPENLSELGRHWLAGLLHHAPGITAMCSPTVNCYRRVGSPWAPTYSNWGVQNRMATYRLKVEGHGRNVYLENRLASAASNPYLVLACTVAAGLDGIKRKLELPKADTNAAVLPNDLDSALTALEADTVLVEALGEDVVKHFVYAKRCFEVEKFKKISDCSEDVKFKEEYKTYFYKA